MLLGRTAEQRQIETLITEARVGRSGALILEGEPGAGKTALVEYAKSVAGDMQVLRATGVEQETEIAFAGLYSLLHPIARELRSLPDRQLSALRSALGFTNLAATPGPDRLAVAGGTHSLLSAAAETRPILMLVDDLQWLDVPTAEALVFAVRRFGSDAIACILTSRPGKHGLVGLPLCQLSGLGESEAEQLVQAVSGVAVSPAVAKLLRAETGGNPMALTALSGMLTPQQLTGIGLHGPGLPLDAGAAILDQFAAGLAGLTPQVRLTLLVAAAAGRCSPAAVLQAAVQVGGALAIDAAEDAGLVSVGPAGIEFTHPLVRSAAYHGGTRAQQRAAHRALATTLAGTDDERVAWHLAAAASSADERAAKALEIAARAAMNKGAPLLAADAWERAAELTVRGEGHTDRLAQAANAALLGGDLSRADRLASIGQDRNLPPELRVRLLAIRGEANILRGRMSAAQKFMTEAAALAEPADRRLAAELLARASHAAMEAGLDEDALRIHEKLTKLKTGSDEAACFIADLAGAWLVWHRGDPERAEQLMRSCVEALIASPALASSAERQLEVASAFARLGQTRNACRHADAAVEIARDEGALGRLPSALADAAWYDGQAGRWQQALARAHQAFDLAEASGQEYLACAVLVTVTEIEAAQGRARECREHGCQAESLAVELELPRQRLLVRRHVASADLAVGRIDEAIEKYEEVLALAEELGVHHPYYSPLPDLIEALARAGNLAQAQYLMPSFAVQVRGTGNPLPRGRMHRLLGILADDDFDGHFQQAIELHRYRQSFQQARSQLSYGERLRRARRRREARAQLRAAVETFDRLDARPWAERARAELQATGETIAKRGPLQEQLTPQELQIAMLVADGRTNAEAGRALFLSTRTVEFHLSRAYRKLGVASRTELARLMAAANIASS